MAVINAIRDLGVDQQIPHDVRRRRLYVMETMRRMGTPVLVKHMYNADDVDAGIAEPSPNFDSVYGQTRKNDPFSFGMGFVSVEKSDDEWVSPSGTLVTGTTISPGVGYVPAPKYRGFGPGYLTYVILPDVAEDVFKLNEVGALIKVQTATAQMGWYPEVNDNDLLVIVELDQNENITETRERYQLKMTNPVSVRGLDRKGRRGDTEMWGNRFVLNQMFELSLLPTNHVLYSVETDR